MKITKQQLKQVIREQIEKIEDEEETFKLPKWTDGYSGPPSRDYYDKAGFDPKSGIMMYELKPGFEFERFTEKERNLILRPRRPQKLNFR